MRRRNDLAEVAGRVFWREAEARQVVEAWRRSGESLARFATRLGLDRRRVSRWAARLAQPAAVRVVPVRVAAPTPEPRGAAIDLELGPGRRLGLAPGFAADDLQSFPSHSSSSTTREPRLRPMARLSLRTRRLLRTA